jgi:hypothetical protein
LYKLCENLEIESSAYDLEVDRRTISKWSEIVRGAIFLFFEQHSTKLGGLDENGTKKIVEIDESYFLKNKYNSGRRNLPIWYVGVERGSNRCGIVPVKKKIQKQ